ncbi:hypothetical protein C8T65DRAFT_154507 [Cerioporus squamosus]|nr:hypothetical protein C8T65DRAFT_154507 [Cerioporus squamosus]
MSYSADAAATAALFDSLYIGNYCTVAASVLFIYDTFITFDSEVACFWTAKRPGGASLLFFANSCSSFSIAIEAMSLLQFVPAAAFSALRAYVLSRSKLLGLFILSLSLAPVAANLVPYGYQLSGENFPPFGCLYTENIAAALSLKFTIISRVPLIATDILLIYITWVRLSSWSALRDVQRSRRLPLSDILFRGGIIYFLVLFVLNVLHLTFSATAVAIQAELTSYVTIFTAPITAILISRFLLALQEANQMVVRVDSDNQLHSSRNPYDSAPSFISSLGGFINSAIFAPSDYDSFELQVRSHSTAGEGAEGGGQGGLPEATALSSSTA